MKIADNRLLLGTIAAFLAYWITATVVPSPIVKPVVDVALIVMAGLVWLRTLPDTFRILVHRYRNDQAPDGDGAHLAIFGVNLIGLGGLVAAGARMALLSPFLASYVIGTPFEPLGQALAATGLLLWLVSPSVTNKGINLGNGLWTYIVFAIALIVVALISHNAGVRDERQSVQLSTDDDFLPADAPRCSHERLIWGSANGVYHVPNSRYRRQVTPVRCFETVDEAEEKGFRAPG